MVSRNKQQPYEKPVKVLVDLYKSTWLGGKHPTELAVKRAWSKLDILSFHSDAFTCRYLDSRDPDFLGALARSRAVRRRTMPTLQQERRKVLINFYIRPPLWRHVPGQMGTELERTKGLIEQVDNLWCVHRHEIPYIYPGRIDRFLRLLLDVIQRFEPGVRWIQTPPPQHIYGVEILAYFWEQVSSIVPELATSNGLATALSHFLQAWLNQTSERRLVRGSRVGEWASYGLLVIIGEILRYDPRSFRSDVPFVLDKSADSVWMNQELERLLRNAVGDANGCLNWNGHIGNDGYGRLRMDGLYQAAHRRIYELTKGPIPPGKELHHSCRNPRCVNSDHLVPLDPSDNLALRVWHTSESSPKGHQYDEMNTYIDSKGDSHCRTCSLQGPACSTS